jgi:hypothetical protein
MSSDVYERRLLMRQLVAAVAVILVLVGCGGNSVQIKGEPTLTRLVFFDGTGAKSGLSKNFDLTEEQVPMETKLIQACKGTEGEREVAPLVAAAAGFVLEKAVSWVVDQVNQALQDEIKKYTANFQASQSVEFYFPDDPAGPKLHYDCFRMTRSTAIEETPGTKKEPGGKPNYKVDMDFVAQLELDSRKEFLIIRPLRLYYADTQAKRDNSGIVGTAISLKSDVVWRQNNKGEFKSGAVDQIILSEKVILSDKHFYKNYFLEKVKDESGLEQFLYKKLEKKVPLIPWSVYDKVTYGGSLITATVTVSETSNPPWLLKHAADLFDQNKDKVATQLSQAAESALGISGTSKK